MIKNIQIFSFIYTHFMPDYKQKRLQTFELYKRIYNLEISYCDFYSLFLISRPLNSAGSSLLPLATSSLRTTFLGATPPFRSTPAGTLRLSSATFFCTGIRAYYATTFLECHRAHLCRLRRYRWWRRWFPFLWCIKSLW